MAGIIQAERERRDRMYERGLKQCNTCTEPLPLSKFAPRPDCYRGLNGTCRRCKSIGTVEWQKNQRERQAVRQKQWRDANPDKWLAISRRRDVRARWRRDGMVSP